MKATIVKWGRETDALKTVDLEEVAHQICAGDFSGAVDEVRKVLPILSLKREDDGSFSRGVNVLRNLPRLCCSSLMVNRNRQRVRMAYTGLVLLEVNNLSSIDEAEAIRQGAASMPHTLLAFVGASGRSVKIVCRGQQMLAGGQHQQEADATDLVFPSDEALERFHVNLYEKARLAYNAQLGVNIEKLEPRLDRVCYLSADANCYFNPDALLFYTNSQAVEQAVMPVKPKTTSATSADSYFTDYHVYQFCLSRAYDDVAHIDDEHPNYVPMLLERLAHYCEQARLPMAIAQDMALFSSMFGGDKQLVRLTFENAYRRKHEADYLERHEQPRPEKVVPAETLLSMKIDTFLRANYELRKNVMRGVAEYRQRRGLGFGFQDLTEEARNSITMRALEQGIKCWDKDIRRYVCSDDIERYDPIADYLDHLPRWDGNDRVKALAQRVKTDYQDWPHLFHIWLRSMVAMWQGKGQLTGNALVPLFIGSQGCGKTSFCRILMPRQLREYYNDRINFKNESDLNLGLTSFALINLDEFDKVTQRQQVVLKYLVSTSELKYRAPYGKAYQQHRRYASFIGTTNDPMPLTDPSGSRRFICVQVKGNIDFQSPVAHDQLFAQLKQELLDGERYWLTKDEEAQLMEHNRKYQRLNGLGEMLMAVVRKPENDEVGQWLSLGDIANLMKKAFGSGFSMEPATLIKMGSILSQPDCAFERRRKTKGMEYRVVVR